MTTFHQITFKCSSETCLVSGTAKCQQDKQYVQSRIHPEGVGVTQRVEHGQERCANESRWQSSWWRWSR
ncbi:hypothetical protein ACNKHT_18960 [Shigella flexneri]